MSPFELPRRDALKAGAGLVGLAAALPAADAWTPKTLDPHQLSTIETLSELIIPTTDTPGAKAAGVPKYVDLFLTDGSPDDRGRFLDGLAWLDSYAQSKHRLPFVRLSPQQQTAILTILDTDGEFGVDPGRRFFLQLKSLVSRIYYNTEIGYRELNKDSRVPTNYWDHNCKP
jgi:hypothetical protein